MEKAYAMETEITGSGRPLVLVPGGLTGWISWKPHAQRLSRDIKVLRVQLLNVAFGLRRERLPEGYSVTTEAAALAAALDGAGIEQADIAAWSFGAEVGVWVPTGVGRRPCRGVGRWPLRLRSSPPGIRTACVSSTPWQALLRPWNIFGRPELPIRA